MRGELKRAVQKDGSDSLFYFIVLFRYKPLSIGHLMAEIRGLPKDATGKICERILTGLSAVEPTDNLIDFSMPTPDAKFEAGSPTGPNQVPAGFVLVRINQVNSSMTMMAPV